MKISIKGNELLVGDGLKRTTRHIDIQAAESIEVYGSDPADTITIRQLDNGEVVVLHEGECYLSVNQ